MLFAFVCLFVCFLQLTLNLIALWLEKMLAVISVFLNLLRLALWPKQAWTESEVE